MAESLYRKIIRPTESRILMLNRIALLGTLSLLFALCLTPAFTAPTGSTRTYLPMAYRGIVLPNEPVLLVSRSNDIYLDPYTLELIQPDGTQHWFLESNPLNNPAIAPDGETILFSREYSFQVEGGTFAINPNGTNKRRTPVVIRETDFTKPTWAPDSAGVAIQSYLTGSVHLIYTPLTGDPVTVTTDTVAEDFAWSADGSSLAYSAIRNGQQDLYLAPRTGGAEQLLFQSPQNEWAYAALPDGRWIIGATRDNNMDIFRINADGTTPVPLFTIPDRYGPYTIESDPTGRFLFPTTLPQNTSYLDRRIALYTVDGQMVWNLTNLCLVEYPSYGCSIDQISWRPDGAEVAFHVRREVSGGYENRLYLMRTDGSESTPRLVIEGEASKPYFSPDGRYFAYESNGVRVRELATGSETVLSQGNEGVAIVGWVNP
jgi:hypothetical protein